MNLKAKIAAAFSLNSFIWLLMLLAFAGLISCAAGLYLVIQAPLGAMPAAFITGGALLGTSVLLVLILVISLSAGGKRSKAKQLRSNPELPLEEQIRPMIGDKATNWARENTGLAVVGALSAGVILAASPRVRATLLGAVGPLLTRKSVQAIQRFSDD